MPTQLWAPRERAPRTYLSVMQRHDLLHKVRGLVRRWCALHRLATRALPLAQRLHVLHMQRLVHLALRGCRVMWTLPRSQHAAHIPAKYPSDFNDDEFRDHFRFLKKDFVRIMGAMGLGSPQDPTQPTWIHVGRRGRQSVVRTDWMLRVFCKRLSSTAPYKVTSSEVQIDDLRFVSAIALHSWA